MPVLAAIVAATRATLPALQARRDELERAALARPTPPSFLAALRRPSVALIAEVKRRSPSAGAINAGLDPVGLARSYSRGGAAAISVLTDGPFFGGSLADLASVADAVTLPALRKDFILDEVQLLEARAAGAAAVLLIVRLLTDEALQRLLQSADALGLGALVETHSAEEVSRAVAAGARVVGVNARDLDDFSIDRDAAWRLLASIPADVVAVAESGMATAADVAIAAAAGADAVLIGSALASHPSPEAAVASLIGTSRHGR